MNGRTLLFLKNILYAAGANLSRIATTFILTLLLPKLLSVEDYSYWQLYAFYGSYLGFSSLGLPEGTLLKYAGDDYRDLDGRTLASQFWNLAAYEILFIAAVFWLGGLAVSDMRKLAALHLALAYIWAQVLRTHLQMILQATNRISEYARSYTFERLFYFGLVLLCLLLGKRDFRQVACMEVVSTSAVLVYAAVLCREVTFRRPLSLRRSLPLTAELIRSGVKLSLASMAGQLIVGIVRIAVEQHWGIDTFGRISLSLSMANMLITCLSAVGIVLYPMLRRADRKKLSELYLPGRTCLTAVMYGLLAFYVPGKLLLELWLPRYGESLRYLAILFPLCIYETRTSVLTWTYLKTLRRERDILRANVCVVLVSLAVTFVTVNLLDSLDMAVLSILGLYALKAVVTETLLSRQMPLRIVRDHLLEAALTAAFILCSWLLSSGPAMAVYLAAYLVYLAVRRKELLKSAEALGRLMMEKETGV